MRSSDLIQSDIKLRFEEKTQNTIQEGSVVDLYNVAVAETLEDVYTEIENAKNPHIFTSLSGQDLDNTGFWVNCPRQTGEDDQSYMYRLMEWTTKREASNTTAIQNALLNPTYASNIDYIPYTRGSGTGTCYVIPKYYDDETIASALAEAAAAIKEVASPSLMIEYIVPALRSVKLNIFMESKSGDSELIKETISEKIRTYINSIAPGSYLKVGDINKIGVNEANIDYFNVLSLFIDNAETKQTEVIQQVDSKFLFDEIIWLGGS